MLRNATKIFLTVICVAATTACDQKRISFVPTGGVAGLSNAAAKTAAGPATAMRDETPVAVAPAPATVAENEDAKLVEADRAANRATGLPNPEISNAISSPLVVTINAEAPAKATARPAKFKLGDTVNYVWLDHLAQNSQPRRLEVVGKVSGLFENGSVLIEVDPARLNGGRAQRFVWADAQRVAPRVNSLSGINVGDQVTSNFGKGPKLKFSGKVTEIFESGRVFIEVDPTTDDGARFYHNFGAEIKDLTKK